MVADGDDFAVVEYDDLICGADCGESVRDDE
jgi:hypothetical protein